MKMTAVIDSTGTVALDMEGEASTEKYSSVMEARRSIIGTASALANETTTTTELSIEDPAGTRMILVQADGNTIEQTSSDALSEQQTPTAAATPATHDVAPGTNQTDVSAAMSEPTPEPAPIVAPPRIFRRVFKPVPAPTGPVTTKGNPFITPPEVVEAEDPIDNDPILGPRESVRGPQNLQQTLSMEPREEVEPAAPITVTTATLWLVAASGGVGTTTLAGMCSENVVDESDHHPTWAGRALLVCSTTGTSLEAAQRLARQSASGQLAYELVGLVIVHDRPKNKLTKPTLEFARGVARMFPVAMTVPYEASWREVGATPQATGTRLKSVLRRIEKIAHSGH